LTRFFFRANRFPLRLKANAHSKLKARPLRPGFFLWVAATARGYFAKRSLAGDWPIELNTDKVW
jgi:hypothetical protein